MKDTVITAKRKRTEIISVSVCFALAVLINIGSIICYKTPFYEVFTQIGYTLVITLVLYLAWIIVRLVCRLFKKR